MDVGKLHRFDGKKEEVVLPGFRFHPTDEELVGFYLKRKVEKKPLRIELIKQIDIYNYDPWDLPMTSSAMEKEWYFFCKRGRKYRNSIRPNRVTKSGFWKATGIDKPIYNNCSVKGKETNECIGLKKSLVYYRGTAGKGTKTDWMMHEFRLPPNNPNANKANSHNHPQANASKDLIQEAEVWTLCRIFKRNASYKRCTPNLEDSAAVTKTNPTESSSSKSCSLDSDSAVIQQNERKPFIGVVDEREHFFVGQSASVVAHQATPTVYYPSFWNQNVNGVFANENWEDLRSVVKFSGDPSTVHDCTETYNLQPYFS